MNTSHILIFKTNIRTDNDRMCIQDVLDRHPLIESWTIDQHDVDCVLRVISPHLTHQEVSGILARCNYDCSELTD